MAVKQKMKTLQQIRDDLSKGVGASRKGFCNEPHPDPKYVEIQKATIPDLETGKPIKDQWGIPVLQDVEVSTVLCNRFAGHPAGVDGAGGHRTFSFLISRADEW